MRFKPTLFGVSYFGKLSNTVVYTPKEITMGITGNTATMLIVDDPHLMRCDRHPDESEAAFVKRAAIKLTRHARYMRWQRRQNESLPYKMD